MIVIKTHRNLPGCHFLGKSRIDNHNVYRFESFAHFSIERIKPQDFEYIDTMDDGDEDYEKIKKYKNNNYV